MTSNIHKLTKETIASKTCMGLLHRGPYSQISETFEKFFALLNDGNSKGKKEPIDCGCDKALGLYLDDPYDTAPENLRSYAAMEIGKDASIEEFPKELKLVEVPGGTAAVLTVKGSYSQLGEAWQGFGKRITDEGWKFSNDPNHICQEIYVTMDMKDETKNVTKLIMFLEE